MNNNPCRLKKKCAGNHEKNVIFAENGLAMIADNMLYTSRMKLADIITSDSVLLSIIERLNISLGFGDATVAEVCCRYDISSELFVMICNIYSFPNHLPDIARLKPHDVSKIITYLRESHNYYSNVCFPHLHENIHKMSDKCNAMNNKLINRFYDDYDAEVSSHFDYEESTVFPYIEGLIAGNRRNVEGYNIERFKQNHSNIEEKLNDLKNIILKYLPESCSCRERIETLAEIFRIEYDLDRHTLIENKVLIPLVAKLEQQ